MKDKNIKSFREFNENLNISDVIGSKKSFNVSDDEIEVGDYCIMTNDFGDKYLVEVIKKIKSKEWIEDVTDTDSEKCIHCGCGLGNQSLKLRCLSCSCPIGSWIAVTSIDEEKQIEKIIEK